MTDIFVNGMIVKAPHARAPEFVKASISIKREDLVAWLSERSDEWVNIVVKESKGGKWYAAVDNWKPQEKPENKPGSNVPTGEYKTSETFNDDIPF